MRMGSTNLVYRSFIMLSLIAVTVVTGTSLFYSSKSKGSAFYTDKYQCVRIYYDRTNQPEVYWMGRTYAIFVQNLLGHFPNWQQIVSPIELYQKGEIETCDATIYLGSYFENKIPQSFFDDFANTKKRVVWAGYTAWKYPPDQFKKLWGYEYVGLTSLDQEHLDSAGRPSFFRDITYKGEVFHKFGEEVKIDLEHWDSDTEFRAGFEQVRLKLAKIDGPQPQVLAYAKHSASGEVIPYLIKNENRFYFADIPLSFMHESDRMLIFADVLFDILGEKPRHTEKYALIRIEDIHPLTPLGYLEKTLQVFRDEKVPIAISLIPIFYDPLKKAERGPDEEFVPMDRSKVFMELIERLKKEKASFIVHGATHQYGKVKNPHDGVSGSDFEFWDAVHNRPLAVDSPRWVLDRLEDGFFTVHQAGLNPLIWLTPHYQASPIDYNIFAKVFPWNIGRVIYYNYRVSGVRTDIKETDLWFNAQKPENLKNRYEAFKDLKTKIEFDRWNGQIFPYEIFGDIHGQRLIPENLGNSQPYISSHVVRTRSVQQIIADAKRNLVLRDAWASLFYHSVLIGPIESGGRGAFPGDTTELLYIIQELKKLGYKFIDINDWAKKNTIAIRPEPIVRDTLVIN